MCKNILEITVVFIILIGLDFNLYAKNKEKISTDLNNATSYQMDQQLYLDLEPNQVMSVFSQPGFNYLTCTRALNCEAVGWPNKDAFVNYLGNAKSVSVKDPRTGAAIQKRFLFVDFSYTPFGESHSKSGQGWIDELYVSKSKQESAYGAEEETTSKKEYCPPKYLNPKDKHADKALSLSNSVDLSRKLADHIKTDVKESIEKIVQQINGIVGKCIDPKGIRDAHNQIVYDQLVIPELLKTDLTQLQKPDGTNISREELIEIDALSRTNYAEMATTCPIEYVGASAKVAINRLATYMAAKDKGNTGKMHEMIGKDHHPESPLLARILTEPSKYNNWDYNKISGDKLSNIRQSLCPPISPESKYFGGPKAPKPFVGPWLNSLRVAIEAILFGTHFGSGKRAGHVKSSFYSSAVDMAKMKEDNTVVSVFGRTLKDKNCIRLWKDPK